MSTLSSKRLLLDGQTRQIVAGMLHATFGRLMAADVKELSGLAADRDRLDNERVKLLQAHFVDAVPLDLLKQEQARIGAELETISKRIAAHHDQYAEARANLEDSIGHATVSATTATPSTGKSPKMLPDRADGVSGDRAPGQLVGLTGSAGHLRG